MRRPASKHGSFFGCPFISVGVEATAGSGAHTNAVGHTRRRHEWLRTLCQDARADDPEALAQQLGLLIDGALATGRLMQDRQIVDGAKGAARSLIERHTHAH